MSARIDDREVREEFGGAFEIPGASLVMARLGAAAMSGGPSHWPGPQVSAYCQWTSVMRVRRHFIGCFSKNSQMRSLAETVSVDLPRNLGFLPGQVWPPPSTTTSTTSAPSLPGP